MLRVFRDNGIDRVFVVPGESYLGLLDALNDFPDIDLVTCRHESGAAFMAGVDGRITGTPGVAMVSRGPGATNASIGVHAAQQDGTPLILVVGQVSVKDLRREAFQEIDYQKMYGSIAKWVCEVTSPRDLAEAAFKAIRVATAGVPGPVVLVIPEDVQQELVERPHWIAVRESPARPDAATLARVRERLSTAKRPLVIAGGGLAVRDGRAAVLKLAEEYELPVAVSFREHDLFPNDHPLFVGDLGLANPADQIAAFESSDLILALGTRLGDITTQGYTFPRCPRPSQTLVHCIADGHFVNQHFMAEIGLVADPIALARALVESPAPFDRAARREWATSLRAIHERIASWPTVTAADGVPFVDVVRALRDRASDDVVLCLDAGTFAAPVYQHFSFVGAQRLMASFSGAMGYGTPAAVASQMRWPNRKVVCMVGDGGFMMTGNEMIAAVDRGLPILFVLANNNCYGSIRIHQDREYPGRHLGTTLSNPDFTAIAQAFGMEAERVERVEQVGGAIARGLAATRPYFIEVETSLSAVLPGGGAPATGRD
jgi:acetolactate synthase-1/2/3 large subunit